MSRTYSDPSYGSKKVLQGVGTGNAINGTNAAATTLVRILAKAESPLNVVDFGAANLVIGTQAIANKIVLNSHSAGTGAAVAMGTVTIGTAGEVIAAGATIDGSATGSIAAGDALSVTLAAGTETAANLRIVPIVEYTETFVVSDN